MLATVYLSLFFLCVYLVGLAIRRLVFLRDRARMARQSRAGARMIARIEEMQPGSVKKFGLICRKYRVDGFLINHQGEFHAYVNSCRHMTTPLDFMRNQFLTEDGRNLVCMTHGALYEPASGLCVAGPCKGLSLYRLPVLVDRGEVLVGCPSGDVTFLADL